jgi:hypothetical protein
MSLDDFTLFLEQKHTIVRNVQFLQVVAFRYPDLRQDRRRRCRPQNQGRRK